MQQGEIKTKKALSGKTCLSYDLEVMKIALLGKGKMGKMVEKLAHERGDSIVTTKEADVLIDFSHAKCVIDHIHEANTSQKPIIIGTTGWEKNLPLAKDLIKKNNNAALYAPNFSIGVTLFVQLLKKARELFSDYEIAGVEFHHNQKLDAPSGTANYIAKTLEMTTPFTSVRCGRIPGKHVVIFDSPFDSITLTHEAHDRKGWALGALKAAEWIQNKKGWFSLDEMLRSLYSADHPF